MGRNSGGVTSGGTPKGRGDVNYKGKITGLRDLVTVKDKAVYKELKEGISRYHTMLGVRQKDVRVGTMENGVLGVHATIGGTVSYTHLTALASDCSVNTQNSIFHRAHTNILLANT